MGLALGDTGFDEAVIPASDVGQDQHLSGLAADESGQGLAVVEGKRGEVEMGIDVAVGIEDVLAQPRRAPRPDAVQLWSDQGSLPGDLVAGEAVAFIDLFARGGVSGLLIERFGAFGDELVQRLTILWRWWGEGGAGGQKGSEAVPQVSQQPTN